MTGLQVCYRLQVTGSKLHDICFNRNPQLVTRNLMTCNLQPATCNDCNLSLQLYCISGLELELGSSILRLHIGAIQDTDAGGAYGNFAEGIGC